MLSLVSKVKLTCSTNTHENNMTNHTTDEAPGCGATHFALFGNLNFREHDPASALRHR